VVVAIVCNGAANLHIAGVVVITKEDAQILVAIIQTFQNTTAQSTTRSHLPTPTRDLVVVHMVHNSKARNNTTDPRKERANGAKSENIKKKTKTC